ncbi:hypothetical protein CC1G_14878 [Coprinopsis cinerea okayama7|uniref:Uncharacterized protein n=1 Tax=Coprinopsis cinerea (strain Okayama-7 / 130 / ATCC MYA-4618 / FGSC 9003) TaxID=240176 RepID=D6RNJ1_COPC7|nr:hypothetical protein CC1G_14878 [Coprinopsis cinerea okayama7\|eukprot:XP_002910901.1 hypothetical protein CC1G_14878 [Coprinopsis cinerea okayama7\
MRIHKLPRDIACVGRFHGVQAIKEFVDWALGSVVSGDTTAKAVEFTPTGLKVATEGTRTFKNGESKAFNSFVTTITKAPISFSLQGL